MREPIGSRPALERVCLDASSAAALYECVLRAERATVKSSDPATASQMCGAHAAINWIQQQTDVVVANDNLAAHALGMAIGLPDSVVLSHLPSDIHDLRRLFDAAIHSKARIVYVTVTSPQFTDLDSGDAVGIAEALAVAVEQASIGEPSIVRYSLAPEAVRRRDRASARCQLTFIERRMLPDVLDYMTVAVSRLPRPATIAPTPAAIPEAAEVVELVDESKDAPIGPSSTIATAVRRAREAHQQPAMVDVELMLTDDEQLKVMLGTASAGGSATLTIRGDQLESLPAPSHSGTLIICESDMSHGLPHGLAQATERGWAVAAPTTPADVEGLATSALRAAQPLILLIDTETANSTWGPLPLDDGWVVPVGPARVARSGEAITIVAVGPAVSCALEAARQLAIDGCEATVIDARTLHPLGVDAAARSARMTHRVLIIDEASGLHIAARIAAAVTSEAFFELDAPPMIITATHPDSIVAAARIMLDS